MLTQVTHQSIKNKYHENIRFATVFMPQASMILCIARLSSALASHALAATFTSSQSYRVALSPVSLSEATSTTQHDTDIHGPFAL
jgi:hypothetical protein